MFPSPDGELVGKGSFRENTGVICGRFRPLTGSLWEKKNWLSAHSMVLSFRPLTGSLWEKKNLILVQQDAGKFPSPDGELVGKGCLLKGAPRLG